ncbi:MAG: O-antigen ligase family protein [candidate division Zixibacteria bacterium]|nr:O-antigen ligase family protein [candidate division Zixibacteria bacterium]
MKRCFKMAAFDGSYTLKAKNQTSLIFPLLILFSLFFSWVLTHSPLLALAMSLGLPLTIAALVSVRLGFYLLVIGSVLSRFVVPIPWGNLKIEQLIFLIVILGLALRFLPDRNASLKSIKIDRIGALAIFWVLANVLSSLLYSPDKVASLKICLWLGFSVGIYLLTKNIVGKKLSIEKAIKAVLIVGVLEASYGLAACSSFLLGKDIGGAQTNPVISIPKAYGTIWEPNIFGIFLVSIALIIFNLLLSKEFTKFKVWLWGGFLLVLLGIIVSFTRTAWMILVMFLFFSLLISIKFFLKRPTLLLSLVIFVSIFVILLNSSFLGTNIIEGLGKAYFSDYSTVTFRLIRIDLALNEWKISPLLGLGTNSFGQRYYDPSRENAPDYLGVLFVQNLYDTGIIGLGLILALIILQVKKGVKFLKLSSNPKYKTLMKGLLIGFLALVAMYQSTSAFWFGFNWIYLGLMSAIYDKGLQESLVNE